jgi:hypothetical protein
MYFEKNISALTAHDAIHPHLLKKVSEAAPSEDIELFSTDDGHYTIQYRGILIHDPAGPIQEARSIVREHSRSGLDRVHILFGLGLGYLLDEMYRFSEGKIVVYEPDVALLRFVLENVDLSEILGSGRVCLTGADYQMTFMMREKIYKNDQIDVLPLKSYAYLLADEIPNLMGKIVGLFEDRLRDIQTSRYYHFRWFEALFKNYPHFVDVTLFDELVGRFEGKPALIIASGPSLDAALPSLRETADSMVLIAVGGALRRLSQEGIVPDFAVFYDAIGMKEQLQGLPAEYLQKITMLVWPVAQDCCYETPVGARVMFMAKNAKQISSWLDSVLGGEHYRLEGGGSVSLVAFQAALAMGCSEIILVGQDLAYTNNQAYAGGVGIREDENGRIVVVDPSNNLYVEPARQAEVMGQNGEMMLSSAAYQGFVRHFQDLALDLAKGGSSVKLYNASMGGAHLEGYVLKPLAEFVGRFEAWKAPGQPAWKPENSAQELAERRQKLENGLVDLRARAEKAYQLFEEMRQSLLKNAASGQQGLSMLHMAVESAVTRFFGFVKEDNFLSYVLLHEALEFSEKYQAGGKSGECIASDFEALDLMLSNSMTHLGEKLIPWVNEARKRMLTDQSPTEFPASISA